VWQICQNCATREKNHATIYAYDPRYDNLIQKSRHACTNRATILPSAETIHSASKIAARHWKSRHDFQLSQHHNFELFLNTINESGTGPIDVRLWGKALDVISNQQSRYYIMTYGVPCDRMGALGMLITDPQSMFVIHLYGTRERVSVFLYDPRSSTLEACLDLEKVFDVKVAISTSQQTTTITGLNYIQWFYHQIYC